MQNLNLNPVTYKYVKDILGNPIREWDILVYRQAASMYMGLAVKVNPKTAKVLRIPCDITTRSHTNNPHYPHGPFTSLVRGLEKGTMGYMQLVRGTDIILSSLEEILKSPNYQSQELKDILCHHLTP
jgi:hypothetical protein